MEAEKMEIKTEPITEEGEGQPQVPSQEAAASGTSSDTIKDEDGVFQIIPRDADSVYLTVNDTPWEEDELIEMSIEEVRDFIAKEVYESMVKDNPLEAVDARAKEVLKKLMEQNEEFTKLANVTDILEREQMKYLRKQPETRKALVKTGGVGVDLAVLASSLPDVAKRGMAFRQSTSSSKPGTSRVVAPAAASGFATKPAQVLAAKSTPAFPTKPLAAAAAKVATASATVAKTASNVVCIDLTDESEGPSEPAKKAPSSYAFLGGLVKHPAPLPPKPSSVTNKDLPPVPPKPRLKISSEERGIVLQWDMVPNAGNMSFATLKLFEIFGYQEQAYLPINTLLWKKIGDVKAMALPMACTLTQFIEGNKYHFSIRAVDEHGRCGFYSDPISVVYTPKKK